MVAKKFSPYKNLKGNYAMKTLSKKQTLNTLLAGAVTLAALGGIYSANAMGIGEGQEKCYGVVKAGMNDCASSDGAHSCGAQATADAMATDWVSVPKGLCEKLANGSTEPVVVPTPDAPKE